MEYFNCHKRGHYSNRCPEKEEPEKKKAMIAFLWGDSDSDTNHEELKTRCLMADDDKVSIFEDKTFLKNMIFEIKRIVDNQAETIEDNDSVIELQLESMKESVEHMNNKREKIDYL